MNDSVEFGKPKSISDMIESDGSDKDFGLKDPTGGEYDPSANKESVADFQSKRVNDDFESQLLYSLSETQASPNVINTRIVVEHPYIGTSEKPDFSADAQNALLDKSDEGGVARTGKSVIGEPKSAEQPKSFDIQAPAEGRRSLTPNENVSRYIPEIAAKERINIDGSEVVKGFADAKIEGGVMIQRVPKLDFSTTEEDGQRIPPGRPNQKENSGKGSIELSGFSVSYNGQSIGIDEKYDDLDSALAVISGNKYIGYIDGNVRFVPIVSGKPIIVKDGRQFVENLGGQWRRI